MIRFILFLIVILNTSGCYLHKHLYLLQRPKRITVENQLAYEVELVFTSKNSVVRMLIDEQSVTSIPIYLEESKDELLLAILSDEYGWISVHSNGETIYKLSYDEIVKPEGSLAACRTLSMHFASIRATFFDWILS